MAKTILVPVDLRIASLNTLKLGLESYPGEAPSVILMYSEYLSDSITELIFHSPSRILSDRLSSEFREAVEILRNRFGNRMGDINLTLFSGFNTNAFRNFAEANNIDLAFIPKSYRLQTPKRAFNPIPFIKRSGIPLLEIDWQADNKNEQEQLSALFN